MGYAEECNILGTGKHLVSISVSRNEFTSIMSQGGDEDSKLAHLDASHNSITVGGGEAAVMVPASGRLSEQAPIPFPPQEFPDFTIFPKLAYLSFHHNNIRCAAAVHGLCCPAGACTHLTSPIDTWRAHPPFAVPPRLMLVTCPPSSTSRWLTTAWSVGQAPITP